GLERAHAQFFGQGKGLAVVGFGLRGIGGIGGGIDSTKLVQCERLVPARLLLLGQVERLAGMLPGLLAGARPPTGLTEPRIVRTSKCACADPFADCLLQQRTPLCEAPLERICRAQACRDPWPPILVAGVTTEGQALLQHLDGGLQVPLGEVQETKADADKDWCVPSAVQCGATERLLPVAPALGEGSERTQGQRQPRPRSDPRVC